MQSSKTTFKT